jgi:Flp pilus assembly protein TadD
LYRKSRFDEAEAIFRRAVVNNPHEAEALNSLAWELAMREPGNVDEALQLINRAIEIRGSVPTLVDTRGVVFIRAKLFDRALQDLRVARAGEPTNPSYAFHLAWALLGGGNTEEARKEFREAERLGVEAKVNDPLSRKVLDKMRQTLARN